MQVLTHRKRVDTPRTPPREEPAGRVRAQRGKVQRRVQRRDRVFVVILLVRLAVVVMIVVVLLVVPISLKRISPDDGIPLPAICPPSKGLQARGRWRVLSHLASVVTSILILRTIGVFRILISTPRSIGGGRGRGEHNDGQEPPQRIRDVRVARWIGASDNDERSVQRTRLPAQQRHEHVLFTLFPRFPVFVYVGGRR